MTPEKDRPSPIWNFLLTTRQNRSSRHQFRVRIIYHVIQTLDSAAKSFVSRLLLLFLLFDNMIEGKNGEMGKLQNIFKLGMTEYPKTFCFCKKRNCYEIRKSFVINRQNQRKQVLWGYRNSEVLEPAPLSYHCYFYGYYYYCYCKYHYFLPINCWLHVFRSEVLRFS